MLSDLDIGMNDWMVPKLTWDDAYRPDRGKVLSADELEAAKSFYRYLDVDGDGIPQRTLPGVHPKGAYFTRGSGHNKFGAYTEDADEYQEVLDRLARKIQNAAKAVPAPVVADARRARRWGSSPSAAATRPCVEALDLLAKDGIALDYMRVRGFPFGDDVRDVPRRARRHLRRRAEPRRAAAQPADARDRRADRPSSSRCATTAASR